MLNALPQLRSMGFYRSLWCNKIKTFSFFSKPDSIQFADKNISKIQNIIVHPKKADNVNNIALIELSEAIK